MLKKMVFTEGFRTGFRRIMAKNPQFEAEILAALDELKNGTYPAGRVQKLQAVPEPIYVLRIRVERNILRVLFSKEGPAGELVVCLDIFHKKGRKIDKRRIDNAVARIRAWRKARDTH